MSKRQDIITELISKLATITKTNGYATDIGSKVYEWKTTDVGSDEENCIVVWDTNSKVIEPYEEEDNTDPKHWKQLTVKMVVVTSGATTAANLRSMIADVYKLIGLNVTWGGNAWETILEGDEMILDQQKKLYGATEITINIVYVVNQWAD